MSATNGPTEQESRDVAEAARESEWTAPSFVRELFLGNFRLDLIHPYPRQAPEDKRKTDEYIARLRPIIERADSDAIDRTGEIPPELVDELRAVGAFGLKIPEEYGGIGLSQVGYGR
ncbi:MAG TPA: acyl-CoA dehydrogenase family protein, partial [Geminicoccaceae bacterium]